MAKTFGDIAAIPTRDFCNLPLAAQKEGILLMREMGLTKRQIMQHTKLFKGEYDRLFDGSLPLYKLDGGEE